ncbi:hypothetical protein DFS34DRAFT_310046 [Phlyctochytrium arcticum]|nr:hypothetical protein DFS34DRAFT_310046 [Phlyctochytrium arcticum]
MERDSMPIESNPAEKQEKGTLLALSSTPGIRSTPLRPSRQPPQFFLLYNRRRNPKSKTKVSRSVRIALFFSFNFLIVLTPSARHLCSSQRFVCFCKLWELFRLPRLPTKQPTGGPPNIHALSLKPKQTRPLLAISSTGVNNLPDFLLWPLDSAGNVRKCWWDAEDRFLRMRTDATTRGRESTLATSGPNPNRSKRRSTFSVPVLQSFSRVYAWGVVHSDSLKNLGLSIQRFVSGANVLCRSSSFGTCWAAEICVEVHGISSKACRIGDEAGESLVQDGQHPSPDFLSPKHSRARAPDLVRKCKELQAKILRRRRKTFLSSSSKALLPYLNRSRLEVSAVCQDLYKVCNPVSYVKRIASSQTKGSRNDQRWL